VVSRYILLILSLSLRSWYLTMQMPFPYQGTCSIPSLPLFSLLFLVFLLFFSFRNMKKTPLVSSAYSGTSSPISLESFIALGLDPYFEHRNYLPVFGVFLALASLALDAGKSGARMKQIILFVALLLSVLTFMRNGVWREGRLLWQDAVEKAPNNVRARINLGVAYAGSGQTDKAIEQYQAVLKENPNEPGPA